MRSHWRVSVAAAATLCAAVAFVPACGDDESPAAPQPSRPSPPTTPLQVVEQLELAWSTQDSALFASLLHEGFTFHTWEADQLGLGVPATWDRGVELQAAGRIFRGLPGRSRGPAVAPPVESCQTSLTIEEPTWEPPGQPHPPGTLEQACSASIPIENGSRYPLWVRGTQVLQCTPSSEGARATWQLWSWEDLGIPGARKRAAETISWGAFKYIYGPELLPTATTRSVDAAN